MELIVGGPIIGDISKDFDQYWNDNWSFPAAIFIAENNADATANSAVQPTPSIRKKACKKDRSNGSALLSRLCPDKLAYYWITHPLKTQPCPMKHPSSSAVKSLLS